MANPPEGQGWDPRRAAAGGKVRTGAANGVGGGHSSAVGDSTGQGGSKPSRSRALAGAPSPNEDVEGIRRRTASLPALSAMGEYPSPRLPRRQSRGDRPSARSASFLWSLRMRLQTAKTTIPSTIAPTPAPATPKIVSSFIGSGPSTLPPPAAAPAEEEGGEEEGEEGEGEDAEEGVDEDGDKDGDEDGEMSEGFDDAPAELEAREDAAGFPKVELGMDSRKGGEYSNWPVKSSVILMP